MKINKITITLISCVFALQILAQNKPSYTIKNATDEQIRIEGINSRVAQDLYFSTLTEPGETISFQGGSGYPHAALAAKKPNSKARLAITNDLPIADTYIVLTKEDDTYTFEIQRK